MSGRTIVAIATPHGRGAVGIVRLSGPQAVAVAQKLCGALPPPRQAALRAVRDAGSEVLDDALVLHFAAPASYTGEDVVEIQSHGAPVVLEAMVDAACVHGAERARPGEFTERAFVNGRLDLSQAEAVADLIDAASTAAARAARASLAGAFSQRIHALAGTMMELRMQVEGAIDFSDEDVDWLAEGDVRARLDATLQQLQMLRTDARAGSRLAEGLQVVLAGAPNTGKSTLMNRLCGDELAIVTELPGTTRDVLRHDFLLDGVPVRLIDTAGLREAGDVVEAEGVRRARAQIAQADIVLLMRVDGAPDPQDLQRDIENAAPHAALLHIHNKCDLSGTAPGPVDGDPQRLRISARDGYGIDALRTALRHAAGISDTEAPFSARQRHLEALNRAIAALTEAAARLQDPGLLDTAADELRRAHDALGEITGAVTTEDLLGAIFSRFCIGK